MSPGVSQDVKVALSYIEEANSALPLLNAETDKFTVNRIARQLMDDSLLRAEQRLTAAADRGEDVSGARELLLAAQTSIATIAADRWRTETLEPERQCSAQWADLCISKASALIKLAPTSRNHLLYGIALHTCGREQDALESLMTAVNSDDEESGIEATKVMERISDRSSSSSKPVADRSRAILSNNGLGSLPRECQDQVIDLLTARKTIQAIKLVRDSMRIGLKEAKDAVEGASADLGIPVSPSACFIATACYGSYDHPDVLTLRRWRDNHLQHTAPGRLFIDLYYRISPAIAHYLGRRSRLSDIVRRCILEPLVRRLR
jgi:ribosomal protein L7/L12